MKKLFRSFLMFAVLTGMLFAGAPAASAYTPVGPWRVDLKAFIHDRAHREYVEMMVDHHMRTNKDIHHALEGGFSV